MILSSLLIIPWWVLIRNYHSAVIERSREQRTRQFEEANSVGKDSRDSECELLEDDLEIFQTEQSAKDQLRKSKKPHLLVCSLC